MADEGAVDVDERKGDQRDLEGGRPALVASGASKLSPVQEAWGAYVGHATRCPDCRSLGGGPCERAEELYRAFGAAGVDAYRRLNGGSS